MKPMVASLTLTALLGAGMGGYFAFKGAGGDAPLLESPALPTAATPTAPQGLSRPFKAPTPPTERERWAQDRQARFPGENEIPDPDGVGPCPPADVANRAVDARVYRRGLMHNLPTWWHDNGMITQIGTMTVNGQDTYGYIVSQPTKAARIDMRLEDPSYGTGKTPPPASNPARR